ncbi:MAG: TRAP transporter substrate-binding protein DctP [Nitrospirae bacterium]|nr:TRAP transporter substrate-binding protein DctP [Nitrospirota bacterium]
MSHGREYGGFLSTVILGFFFLFPLQAASETPPSVVLRFGSLAPRGSTWDRTFKQIFDEITSLSQGRIKAKSFFGGVLGDEPEMVRKMKSGELDGALMTTLGIQEIVAEMAVLEIPFLFDSLREVDRMRPALKKKFGAQFEREGFSLLSLTDQAGFIQMYSRERISTLSDLARQKVWVWEGNAVHAESYRSLEIEPVPLPVPAVGEGLASGRINVITTTPLTCLALGWHQYLRFVLKLDYRYAPAVILLRRERLQSLGPELRKLLETVFEKYEPQTIQTMRQDNEHALAGMKKRGMEIVVPSVEALEEFKAKTRPVADDLVRKGLFPRALVDEILKLKKEET